jgi:transcriptional repressor NrdR
MRCPRCGSMDDRVVDSRMAKEGRATRRRRECLDCGYRYTTYEYIETSYPGVVKKDGRREPFDPVKLEKGIARACEKRPVSALEIKDIVERVTAKVAEEYPEEVSSEFIGERVMELLRGVDQVAYVRFASVYRQFRDVAQFKEELERLLKNQ